MPYGITQCYLPPGRCDIPVFNPADLCTCNVHKSGLIVFCRKSKKLENSKTKLIQNRRNEVHECSLSQSAKTAFYCLRCIHQAACFKIQHCVSQTRNIFGDDYVSDADSGVQCPLNTIRLLIRYDTRCYFNVRSKADMNRLNLPHGDDN